MVHTFVVTHYFLNNSEDQWLNFFVGEKGVTVSQPLGLPSF